MLASARVCREVSVSVHTLYALPIHCSIYLHFNTLFICTKNFTTFLSFIAPSIARLYLSILPTLRLFVLLSPVFCQLSRPPLHTNRAAPPEQDLPPGRVRHSTINRTPPKHLSHTSVSHNRLTRGCYVKRTIQTRCSCHVLIRVSFCSLRSAPSAATLLLPPFTGTSSRRAK